MDPRQDGLPTFCTQAKIYKPHKTIVQFIHQTISFASRLFKIPLLKLRQQSYQLVCFLQYGA